MQVQTCVPDHMARCATATRVHFPIGDYNCQGDATQEMERATTLGYRLFRCRPCRRTFNERTGTPFNHLQVPTDIALLVVLWRLRYKRSLRDLAEMFLTRGFTFTHETVRDWEERFAPC